MLCRKATYAFDMLIPQSTKAKLCQTLPNTSVYWRSTLEWATNNHTPKWPVSTQFTPKGRHLLPISSFLSFGSFLAVYGSSSPWNLMNDSRDVGNCSIWPRDCIREATRLFEVNTHRDLRLVQTHHFVGNFVGEKHLVSTCSSPALLSFFRVLIGYWSSHPWLKATGHQWVEAYFAEVRDFAASKLVLCVKANSEYVYATRHCQSKLRKAHEREDPLNGLLAFAGGMEIELVEEACKKSEEVWFFSNGRSQDIHREVASRRELSARCPTSAAAVSFSKASTGEDPGAGSCWETSRKTSSSPPVPGRSMWKREEHAEWLRLVSTSSPVNSLHHSHGWFPYGNVSKWKVWKADLPLRKRMPWWYIDYLRASRPRGTKSDHVVLLDPQLRSCGSTRLHNNNVRMGGEVF